MSGLSQTFERGVSGALSFLSEQWEAFAPEYPFDYRFQEDKLAAQYLSEDRLSQFFFLFSALVIVIACLGLFGLVSFTTEQRTKEVGIRKVLGASSRQIVLLLSKEVTLPVVIAFLIAAPLTYYGIELWLQEFAFRTEIGVGMYGVAAVFLLGMAWLTVGYNAVRAAGSNPVDSIRHQ